MDQNPPGSNESLSTNPKSKNYRSIIIGVLGLLIITPLLIYTNCGNIQDGVQSQLDSTDAESGVHQKTFVDIAGEHFDGLKTMDENITYIGYNELKRSSKILLNQTKKYIPASGSCSLEAYLKTPNADVGDFFGSGLAVSENRIVVGAAFEDSNQTTVTNGSTASSDNNKENSGAAYVFVRSNGQWQQEAYLKTSNADSGDGTWSDVSMSGDRIVIGNMWEDSNQSWITNSNEASADNSFNGAGAAYVFARVDGQWQQEAYLKASNANAADNFGGSTSISGDRLVVGAYDEDSNQSWITNGNEASTNNSFSHAGAAYVFARVDGQWQQEAYLKASNADGGDGFGFSVSISGDRIAVSTPDEDSSQNYVTNGNAASSDNSQVGSGAAYVFARVDGQWQQEAYLKASNASQYDKFGRSVGISGNRIVVAAPHEACNQNWITNGPGPISCDVGYYYVGAAYVFARVNGQWQQEAYIKPSNAANDNVFAQSISISGNRIVAGQIEQASAAYTFVRVNGLWQEENILYNPNSADGDVDDFGLLVSVSGNLIAVSAPSEDTNQNWITNGSQINTNNDLDESGAVYVYRCPINPLTVEPAPVPIKPGPAPVKK